MKNKKIKICFISPFAYGLFNTGSKIKFGGAEVQMYLLATELAKDENFDVNFAVLDVGQKENMEMIKGVRVFKSYKRGRTLLNLIKAPIKLIALLNKINPDIVITRTAGIEVGFSALYSNLRNKKLIYSIACGDDVVPQKNKGFRKKIYYYGFKRANKYVAQNKEQLKTFLENFPNRQDDIKIIKNVFKIKRDNFKSGNDILWVGSSASLKRPELFLKLAEDFPREKFVMIMTKSPSNLNLWNEIHNKVKKFENLKFVEMVDFDKVNYYFSNSKIFVNTSTVEGFPNTFLQTANNKATILSLKVDPSGFIKNDDCGFVCDDDYTKMKEKLEFLLKHEIKRKEMGENSYRYLKKNHDIEENIKNWSDLLLKL